MTAWAVVNAILSAIVCAIVGYKLAVWHERFNGLERIGMGLLAAGCLLTIAPILWLEQTPFEDWAGSLLRLGCAIYFTGRMLRYRYPSHDGETR